MWAVFLTVVPVGLVLGLLAFGRYGGRTPPPPTPGRVLPVAIATVALGPAPAVAFGLAGWLLLITFLIAGLLIVAMLRTPPPAPPLHR
jgi:hypothetical protein